MTYIIVILKLQLPNIIEINLPRNEYLVSKYFHLRGSPLQCCNLLISIILFTSILSIKFILQQKS